MQSPRVGLSLRWKITLPYMFLALGLGLIAILLINRLAAERARDRFTLLLADSGQQATDAVVRVERDLLEVERVAANTQGVLEAALASDAERLRVLILPVVVNARVDMLVVLDPGGTSLLTVRQIPGAAPGEYETLRGENFYAGWPAAQTLLAGGAGDAGEKTAGVEWIRAGGTTLAVFFVGGPLLQSDARPAGAVLVGLYASTLADVLSETAAAAANVSLYNTSGELLGTTLELEPSEYLGLRPEVVQEVAAAEPDRSPVRRIQVAGQPYGEVLVPFVAHDGAQRLGIMGVSLLESGVGTATDTTTVVAFAALALVLTVVIGLLISNSITRPLVRMAAASGEVARGNLETRVPEGGNDEIGVLSRTSGATARPRRSRISRSWRSSTTRSCCRSRARWKPGSTPSASGAARRRPRRRRRGGLSGQPLADSARARPRAGHVLARLPVAPARLGSRRRRRRNTRRRYPSGI